MNKVICPFCGKIHSILNKDGEIREVIHCKCKSPKYKYHNSISWYSGIGYQALDENMNFVDVVVL